MDCEKNGQSCGQSSGQPASESLSKLLKGTTVFLIVNTVLFAAFAAAESGMHSFPSAGAFWGVFGCTIGLIVNMGMMVKRNQYSGRSVMGSYCSAVITAVILGLLLIGQIVRIILIIGYFPSIGSNKPETDVLATSILLTLELTMMTTHFTVVSVLCAFFSFNKTE